MSTPFGDPSDPPLVGRLGTRQVVFLPRHGADHRFPPHRVNYRANLWALRTLGVRRILAPSAVGALRPDLAPGTLVVPDQVVDSTWDGRPRSTTTSARSCTSGWRTLMSPRSSRGRRTA